MMRRSRASCWLVLGALLASPVLAKTKAAPPASPKAQPLGPVQKAERALAEFERKSDGAKAAPENPAVALESAELQLAVLEASAADDVTTSAQREAYQKRLTDVKAKLEQAKRPKGGAKAAERGVVTALEARHERARQRGIVLMGARDIASGMGSERLDAEQRAFDVGLSVALEKRAAELKRQLATVKAAELKDEVARISMNIPESLRAANTDIGVLAFGRITDRKLGAQGQSLAVACKSISKPDLLWRLRLAETVTRGTLPRAYSPSAVVGMGLTFATEKDAVAALTSWVVAAEAEVRALKGCSAASTLAPLPADLSSLGEASMAARHLAREAATEAALALGRVTGLDRQRDAAQTRVKPQRAEVEKLAASSKAAEKKFQMAASQAKSSLVSLDALAQAEADAQTAGMKADSMLPELAKLRAAEDSMAQELSSADARAQQLKAAIKDARDQTTKLRAAVTKLGAPSGKDAALDAARLAAKANLTRADESLKDAAAAATIAERDWAKARQLAELGPVGGLAARKAKLQQQDDALKAAIAEAKQRIKGVQAQRKEAVAKGSPGGCNLDSVAWETVRYPEQPDFSGSMGGASVDHVDYGDTDGSGAYEAFVFWHGSMSGTAGGDFGHLVVYELDSKCKPRQIGFAEAGLFASGELKGKTFVITSAVLRPDEPTCCPTGTDRSEYRVVAGKLKQLR